MTGLCVSGGGGGSSAGLVIRCVDLTGRRDWVEGWRVVVGPHPLEENERHPSQAYLAIHTSRLMPFTSRQRPLRADYVKTEHPSEMREKESERWRERKRGRKRIKCNQIVLTLFQKTPQFVRTIRAKYYPLDKTIICTVMVRLWDLD